MSAGFTRAHAAILATALLFSTGGAAIKACGLNAWQVASFRSGVAALALALLVPAARRVSPRVLLVAVAYAGTLVSFVLSNKLTTAAQAVFLQAAAPLYVVFLERWLLGTPIARRDLPILGLVGVGVALLFFGSGERYATAPDPVSGNLIAVGSGVCYALLMVGLRWLAGDATAPPGTAAAATLWGNVLAFGAVLPLALPVLGSRPVDWVVIAYLGLFQIGLAYYLMTRAMRTLSALDTAVLLLIEPLLNPTFVWLIHGETPTPMALAGGALVLAATGWRSLTTPSAAGHAPAAAVQEP
ncbi:MAG: EamA family transporter [Vicinamibacteraceae bacterium]